MEKQGVVPDVTIDNHPDQLAKGIDAQLNKAVEMLQVDVAEWKKKKENGVAGTSGTNGSGSGSGSGESTKNPVPPPAEK